MDVESLLAPLPGKPCGPDLEYDPAFMALERAARGKPEQSVGDTLVQAEPPDWRDVAAQSLALFGRTRDLRVAILLTRAWVRGDGLTGLLDGLVLLRELLDRYWEEVHPQLDREDNNDPTMRMSALAPLADVDSLLRDVRDTLLLKSNAVGRVLVRDVLVALGKLPASEGGDLSASQIEAAVRDAAAADPALPTLLRGLVEAAERLDALLRDRAGVQNAPDLNALTGMLKLLANLCPNASNINLNPQMDGQIDETGSSVAGAVFDPTGKPFSGEIRCRDDALKMLDRVCEYLEKAEPGHPAPLFIRRAQRLMRKNFVEIIQDLVPDSLGKIQDITGLEKE